MSKSIFAIGSYGCGNRGDDAILQSICEQFSNSKIYATCGTYEDVSGYLPVEIVPCRLNEGISLPVLGSMIKDSFGILKAIYKTDMLMFGGGSLIHDLTVYNLPFLFFWQLWAKIFRKKVCYFSMGVGPLTTSMGQRLSRLFLKHADGLFVRDMRGYNLCKKIGLENVVLTADAAFAITQKNQCKQKTLRELNLQEHSYFCITASQWFESTNFWHRNEMDFSARIRELAESIRAAVKVIKQPAVFVPTVVHDVQIGMQLKEYLNDVDFRIVPSDWNCMQMAEIIENSSFLLGERMHSIIFAARQKVPFLALIYDEKVHQLLQYLGMEKYGLDLSEVRPETVCEYVKQVLSNRDKIEAILEEKMVEFNKKIETSKQLTANFLN